MSHCWLCRTSINRPILVLTCGHNPCMRCATVKYPKMRPDQWMYECEACDTVTLIGSDSTNAIRKWLEAHQKHRNANKVQFSEDVRRKSDMVVLNQRKVVEGESSNRSQYSSHKLDASSQKQIGQQQREQVISEQYQNTLPAQNKDSQSNWKGNKAAFEANNKRPNNSNRSVETRIMTEMSPKLRQILPIARSPQHTWREEPANQLASYFRKSDERQSRDAKEQKDLRIKKDERESRDSKDNSRPKEQKQSRTHRDSWDARDQVEVSLNNRSPNFNRAQQKQDKITFEIISEQRACRLSTDSHLSLKAMKCLSHPSETLNYYCTDCDLPVCSECILYTVHRTHRVHTFKKIGQILKDRLKQQIDALDGAVTVAKMDYSKAKDYFDNIRQSCANERQKLKRAADEFIKSVTYRLKAVSADLDAIEDQAIAHYTERQKNLQTKIQKLKDTKSRINRILQNEPPSKKDFYGDMLPQGSSEEESTLFGLKSIQQALKNFADALECSMINSSIKAKHEGMFSCNFIETLEQIEHQMAKGVSSVSTAPCENYGTLGHQNLSVTFEAVTCLPKVHTIINAFKDMSQVIKALQIDRAQAPL